MKLIHLITLIIFFTTSVSYSQVFYKTDSEAKANLKAFVVSDYKTADLWVFKTEYLSLIQKDGIWMFTDNEAKADYKIYFTDNESQADVKIFYTDCDCQARWNNPAKQNLIKFVKH